MILKKWNDIPKNLQNEAVKEYYDIIAHKKIQLIIKRLFDILLSIILMIIFSPILLIVSILIKIDSKGSIFYRQERVTQYGKIFKIIKVQNADKIGELITKKQDPRLTRIGRVIRKYRIDEIPQLVNIFFGDMSFVGTRPEVKKYVDMYTDEMKATLLMPAGVTSKASIQYKDEDEIIATYMQKGEKENDIYINRVLPEKMKWNLEYIKKFTNIEDMKIAIYTVIAVMKKKSKKNV